MNDKITIAKKDIEYLIGYIHTLLDFIDVEDFEDEENKELVNDGYDSFVEPIAKLLNKRSDEL